MANRSGEVIGVTWNGGLRAFYLALAVAAALLAFLHASEPGRLLDEVAGVEPVSGDAAEMLTEQPAPPEQRAVAEFIAKRYRVAEQPAAGFVRAAYRTGRKLALDPLLLLAVIAVESRYNPVAQSEFGARGLMQVIPKFHGDKLRPYGGEAALLDPEVNIQIGGLILREYLRKFGEMETALQMYGGAFDDPTSQYAMKVLSERTRLEQLLQRFGREQKAQTVQVGSRVPTEPG